MRKGVTLVEVLVASLILVITVSSVFGSFTVFDRISLNNGYRREAYALLQSQFEYLCSVEGNVIVSESMLPFTKDDTFKFQTVGSGNIPYDIIITGNKVIRNLPINVATVQSCVMEVVGTISWVNTLGETETVSLKTYIPYGNLSDPNI
ncbi:MAG: prepilin-type N-terminal cleavage/methylation domain-containing protein [Candidatus Delongbacteria bacterium]|nr:prepilin-type N-terminal cleavage/methylation domain-containing protein [Candidatus Delongbacteria bacterium]MBN2834372.1 prepilin-type N-terminal cleavage/methylation domain-containing protein [Candidatus Delongbacteria bacterium]